MNNIDERHADIIDTDSLKPARYEQYYRCNDNDNIIAKINFVYFPDSKTTKFVTINSLSPLSETNILEEFQNISLPLMDEYLLAFDGYLVLINFMQVSEEQITDETSSEFIMKTTTFYPEFEKGLLTIINKEIDR